MSKHILLALVIASLLLSACVAPALPAAPTVEAPATSEATATQLAPAATIRNCNAGSVRAAGAGRARRTT